MNRPGRVHYLENYSRLEMEFLTELAEDKLKNQEYLEEYLESIGNIEELNMDMALALINECNLHEESPRTAMRYLNIQNSKSSYDVEVTSAEGVVYKGDIFANPLGSERFSVEATITDDSLEKLENLGIDEDTIENYLYFDVRPSNMKNKKLDGRIVKFKYGGNTIKMTPASMRKSTYAYAW